MKCLSYGVMVAQQVLVLFVVVRIRVRQHAKSPLLEIKQRAFWFPCFHIDSYGRLSLTHFVSHGFKRFQRCRRCRLRIPSFNRLAGAGLVPAHDPNGPMHWICRCIQIGCGRALNIPTRPCTTFVNHHVAACGVEIFQIFLIRELSAGKQILPTRNNRRPVKRKIITSFLALNDKISYICKRQAIVLN